MSADLEGAAAVAIEDRPPLRRNFRCVICGKAEDRSDEISAEEWETLLYAKTPCVCGGGMVRCNSEQGQQIARWVRNRRSRRAKARGRSRGPYRD